MVSLVVGVGNEWRGDDAAGLEVARRLRRVGGIEVLELDGDASALLDAWSGHRRVALVDAARSGAPPGTVHAFRADRGALPTATLRSASTHAFGVPDAIELSRALDRLPRHVEVYAIEGSDFTVGMPLSPAVARAVESVAETLARRHD